MLAAPVYPGRFESCARSIDGQLGGNERHTVGGLRYSGADQRAPAERQGTFKPREFEGTSYRITRCGKVSDLSGASKAHPPRAGASRRLLESGSHVKAWLLSRRNQ